MARGHRHYLPGYVWHITHRCHRKEFLLKLPQDRQRYIYWLSEAKGRYGLSVMNYVVTSNHVHLLLLDTGGGAISKSMQLVAGRTGQECNRRENRKGAFWEDRYHATIVQTNRHLLSCMVYIDLNMVRAGVVGHPSSWEEGGYNEMLNRGEQGAVINREALKSVLGIDDVLDAAYQQAISDALQDPVQTRQPMWTESIAVGDEVYVNETKQRLSSMARGRRSIASGGAYALRESVKNYGDPADQLGIENMVEWNVTNEITNS